MIPSAVDAETQVIPQHEAMYHSPPPSRTQRRTLLAAGLVTTLVVLLGATAFALTRSGTLADMLGSGNAPTGEVADSPEGNAPPVTVQEPQTVEEGEPTPDPGGDESISPEVEEEAQQAVENYYEAVNDDDWTYTYSRLASETQALFTEDEWARRSQWFEETTPTNSTPVSVDVQGTSEEPYAEVEREMSIEDTGDTRITETRFVREDGEWVQQLSGETLEPFMPDSSFEEFIEANGGSTEDPAYITGEEEYVEQAIEDYYQAIEANSFEEAYSLRSSSYQSDHPQSGWIEEWESFEVRDVTINSIKITEVGDSSATATIDGSFEDNTDLPRVEYTWSLVMEDGEWKLDEMLAAEEVE